MLYGKRKVNRFREIEWAIQIYGTDSMLFTSGKIQPEREEI